MPNREKPSDETPHGAPRGGSNVDRNARFIIKKRWLQEEPRARVLKKALGKALELSQLNPLICKETFPPMEQRDARSNSTVTTRLRLIAWSRVQS
jgi:hypothetical protein